MADGSWQAAEDGCPLSSVIRHPPSVVCTMHVSFALFADAANISQEGKLNILGVFDALQIGALPAVHPRATLVVRLKAEEGDEGMHTLAFGWVGPGGEEIWSSSGEI